MSAPHELVDEAGNVRLTPVRPSLHAVGRMGPARRGRPVLLRLSLNNSLDAELRGCAGENNRPGS